MSVKVYAFISGYTQKQAAVSEGMVTAGTALGGEISKKALLAAWLLPILAGAGTGLVVSKLTSPSGKKDVVQKSLVAAELEEAAAELKRKRALDIANEAAKNEPVNPEKTLHIR